jgi:arginase
LVESCERAGGAGRRAGQHHSFLSFTYWVWGYDAPEKRSTKPSNKESCQLSQRSQHSSQQTTGTHAANQHSIKTMLASSCHRLFLARASRTVSGCAARCYSVGLLGIQEDRNGSFLRGPAKAPPLIRSRFNCDSGNTTSEQGVELGLIEDSQTNGGEIQDFGDIPLLARSNSTAPTQPTIQSMYESIAPRLAEIFWANLTPLILGGDHSITYPVVKAIAKRNGGKPVTIIHLDAHPDCYPDFEGNPASHASPFARILEDPDIDVHRLVQIGIRALNAAQKVHMNSFETPIIVIPAHEVPHTHSDISDMVSRLIDESTNPVYVSIDMDVLDPAYAPGVSHRESGGLSVRQVVAILQALPASRIIGADIVEYNVARDVDFLTASAAAKLLKELAAKMVQGKGA